MKSLIFFCLVKYLGKVNKDMGGMNEEEIRDTERE